MEVLWPGAATSDVGGNPYVRQNRRSFGHNVPGPGRRVSLVRRGQAPVALCRFGGRGMKPLVRAT